MALDCNLPKEKPPQPNWPEKLRIWNGSRTTKAILET
jgi:hypothetical protein